MHPTRPLAASPPCHPLRIVTKRRSRGVTTSHHASDRGSPGDRIGPCQAIHKRRTAHPFPTTVLPHDIYRLVRPPAKYSKCEVEAAGTLFGQLDHEAPERVQLAWLIHHEIPTRPPLPRGTSTKDGTSHKRAIEAARMQSFAARAAHLGATRALLVDHVPGTPFSLLQYLLAHGDIVHDERFFLCAFNILAVGLRAHLKRTPTHFEGRPSRDYSLCELAVDCIQRSGAVKRQDTLKMLHVLLAIGVPADSPGCVALPLAVMLCEPSAVRLLLQYGANPNDVSVAAPRVATRAPTVTTQRPPPRPSLGDMKREEIRTFLSPEWLAENWGQLKTH